MPLDPAGHGLRAVEHSLAGRLGVTDHPGRPAHQYQRLVTGSLQDPSHDELHEVADMHAGGSWIETDVEGNRPSSKMTGKSLLVGGLGQQATPLQFVKHRVHGAPQ